MSTANRRPVTKSVYIAYTGGTIGMHKTAQGYVPTPGFLRQQMALMPELSSELMPHFDLQEYDPLLDSSNMTPHDWVRIASDIRAHYDDYDGFVVLHGTDTMAYTASALSFMLQNIGKTVVITGSQMPLVEIRSDARSNLINSLLIAANYKIPEVCLYFDSKLMRGNRSRKVNANAFDAFASPNFPPLAVAGIDIDIDWNLVLPPPAAPFEVLALTIPKVGEMRLFPGISADVVHNFLQPPIQGLILETYGSGNAPDKDTAFLDVLRAATDRGVVVVSCTQCLQGSVNLDGYATGTALKRAAVVAVAARASSAKASPSSLPSPTRPCSAASNSASGGAANRRASRL